jgi:predicted O-methyltransferase YrrM
MTMTNDPTAVDPVTELENAAWALAAVIATYRNAARGSLADALAADPDRTAVLEAIGLVQRAGDGIVPNAALHDGPLAGNAASARLSSLRQAVDAATGVARGWAAQPDEVLLDQGHASAATGHALATRLVPTLAGLTGRLAAPGSRVLDIGTGVGALAVALVRELPHIRVTAIDSLDRAVRLARAELEQAGPVAERVELRQQDAADLREREVYDLAWLPAPFLSEESLSASLPHIVDAIAPGGWLVAGTNPAPSGELAAAVARWNAIRNGGNSLDSNRMAATLREFSLGDVDQRPTAPGGPILVVGRRLTRMNLSGVVPRDLQEGGSRGRWQRQRSTALTSPLRPAERLRQPVNTEGET